MIDYPNQNLRCAKCVHKAGIRRGGACSFADTRLPRVSLLRRCKHEGFRALHG